MASTLPSGVSLKGVWCLYLLLSWAHAWGKKSIMDINKSFFIAFAAVFKIKLEKADNM